MTHNQSSHTLVPLDFAMRVIPDRPALHKAIMRNQFHIPPLKDAICTKDFMVGVLEKRTWIPRTSELQVRNCADMPTKKELARILYDVMMLCTEVSEDMRGPFMRTAELVLKYPPSSHWTLMMISTISTDNPIFSKNYVRPRFSAQSSFKSNAAMVPSFGDFFEGLPQEMPTKNAGRVSFVSKDQQQAMRVQRLQEQLNKARARIQDEEIKQSRDASSVQVTAFENPLQSS